MKREFIFPRITSLLCGVTFLLLGLSACSSKSAKTDASATPADGTAVASNDNGFGSGKISDLQTVYFPYDAATLTKEARNVLKKSYVWLKDHPTASIQIEGNCDERGSVQYNLALGDRRANAVKNYLKNLGVDTSRLSTISYGSERPVADGHDEAAWAKNRRAESSLVSSHLSQSN